MAEVQNEVITFLLAISLFATQDGPPPEFQRAYQLANEKKFEDALAIFDQILARGEQQRNALFSAGSVAMMARDPKRALPYFLKLKDLEPKSGRVRSALVRAYQAVGDLKARDDERAAMLRLWTKKEDPELAQEAYFVRDEWETGRHRVACIEHFELKGERAVRYTFFVYKGDSQQPEYRISLGSYAGTNAIWRETTKPKPKKDVRLFHLDGYFPNGHATYGMFSPEPSYEEIRKRVGEIIGARRDESKP